MKNGIFLFLILCLFIFSPSKVIAQSEPDNPTMDLMVSIIDYTGKVKWEYGDNTNPFVGGECVATPSNGIGVSLTQISCTGTGTGAFFFFDENDFIIGTVDAGTPVELNPCKVKYVQFPYVINVSGKLTDAADGVCIILINNTASSSR